jgi:hypothetical protein
MRRAALATFALLLLLPLAAQAQPAKLAPEAILAEDSVFYLRFDGIDAHRAAYDKTALAELMRGDLGQFLSGSLKLIQEQLGPGVVKGDVLSGRPPETVMKIHKAAKQLPVILDFLGEKGVVVGIEITSFLPPKAQLVVVLPNGGDAKYRDAFAASLGFLFERQGYELKEAKIAGRSVTVGRERGDQDGPQVAFWVEGAHFVFTFGTEHPEHTIKRVDKQEGPNLTKSALYKKVTAFKQYETVARGYLNVESALIIAAKADPSVAKVIAELGVAGIKDITFHAGFEGKFQRVSVQLNIPGERKGWLKALATPGEVTPKDLPFLPPDASTVTVARLDAATLYDLVRSTTELIAATLPNGNVQEAKQFFEDFEKKIGVDLKRDLLENLEPTVAFYSSFGEGPVFLGSALAFKLKDEKKAADAVRTIVQSLPAAIDPNITVKKLRYHDADIFMLSFGGRGNPFTPSYTVHKGWLVIGIMPNAPKGFVLRSSGKYKSWQPSPLAGEILAEFKKDSKARLIAYSETDPREALRMAASFGQLFVSLISAFGEVNLGTLTVPHYQSLVEPLTPSVTAVLDEGTSIRIESKGTLLLPTDLVGLDSAIFLLVLGAGF